MEVLNKKRKIIILAAIVFSLIVCAVFFIWECNRQKTIEREESEREESEKRNYLTLEPDSKIFITINELNELPNRLATLIASCGEYDASDTSYPFLDAFDDILASYYGDGFSVDYLKMNDFRELNFAFRSETESYVISYYDYFTAPRIYPGIVTKSITVNNGKNDKTYVNFNDEEIQVNPPENWIADKIKTAQASSSEYQPITNNEADKSIEESQSSGHEESQAEKPDMEVPKIEVPDGWEFVNFELSIPDKEKMENPENIRVFATIPDWLEVKNPFPDSPHIRSVELWYKTKHITRGSILCRTIADESDPFANLGMPYEDENSSIIEIGDKTVKVFMYNGPDKGGPPQYHCNYFFASEGVLIHLSLFFNETEKPEIPEIYEQIVSSMVVARF